MDTGSCSTRTGNIKMGARRSKQKKGPGPGSWIGCAAEEEEGPLRQSSGGHSFTQVRKLGYDLAVAGHDCPKAQFTVARVSSPSISSEAESYVQKMRESKGGMGSENSDARRAGVGCWERA